MFGKYNGFVSKARVSACMYFLVYTMQKNSQPVKITVVENRPEQYFAGCNNICWL
jgi:hypothetical protein